jgi:hypothetical protein
VETRQKIKHTGVIKMSEKKKVLKIKVGEVYINKEIGSKPVYMDAWEQTDKKGDKFYSVNLPIFVNEVEVPDKKKDEA